MSNRAAQATSETIVKYEVLFAVRTGVTILLPRVAAFDCAAEAPITFKTSPDNPQDIVINAKGRAITLKGMQKNHLEAAVSRGFIMFYETEKDEVTRCTPCNYQK